MSSRRAVERREDSSHGKERSYGDDRIRRADHDLLGVCQRVHNGRAGAGTLCAGEADGAHRHVVAEADEVVLKGHLGAGRSQLSLRRQGQAGPHRIVGDREKAHVDLPAGGDTGRDLSEGVPRPEPFGTEEMGSQIAIAEAEPALPPSAASSSMTVQVSPVTPHPVSRLSMPASV